MGRIDGTEVDPNSHQKSAEEIKAENRRKMEEQRAVFDQKDSTDQGLLLSIDGAKIKFNAHMGEFKVLTDVPTTQGKLTGTIVEKQVANFTFYDGFKILTTTQWSNFGSAKVQENFVLLKKSILPATGKMPGNAPIETGKIEFVTSGQINIPESLDTKGAPVPTQEDVKVNGYYYNYNGNYEGNVVGQKEGNVNDVYGCDGKGTKKDTFNNTKKLKVNHSDFQKICNIVKHEGLSSEKEEYLYIAHTNYNEAKRIGKTMLQLLNSSYSSVAAKDKVEMPDTAKDNISLHTRAGVIDALIRDVDSNKEDPTDNATQWDGEDFLAWGIDQDLKPDSKTKLGHNKFDEYDSVKISKSLYDSFVGKVTRRRGSTLAYNSIHDAKCAQGSHTHKTVNGKNKAVYVLPNSDFAKKEYWSSGAFYYKNSSKMSFGLEATKVAGYTIFWKKVKVQ